MTINEQPNAESQDEPSANQSELNATEKPGESTIKLDSAYIQLIEKRVKEDIDSWSVWKYQEPFRRHLGASAIGTDCMRELQYGFRWAKAVVRDGRMYRLMERGKLEEPRLFEILRGIGFEVWETDPNTGKQYRFRSVNGHYGGSLDAIATLPTRYGVGPVPVLVSCKTSGTGAAFNKYSDDQMQIAQPAYWAQENAYGHGYGIEYAVWFVVNKNDDSIAVRLQRLDPKYGAQLEKKAYRIVYAEKPLERISKSPAMKTCTFCVYKDQCFKGGEIAKNCRSCKNAHPSPEANPDGSGAWYCEYHSAYIPEHVIPNGCDNWVNFFAE